MRSKEFTQVAFQNCERQSQFCISKKATDGSFAMSAGKYNVLLYVEHGLYSLALLPKDQIHDRMSMMNKGTFTRLSYNTNNGKDTKWNQYGGAGITLNADMKARMAKGGSSGDPPKLGRQTWASIGGKDDIATVFVSVYRLYHNPDCLHTVWSQQARYFKENEDIRKPDVHALFIRDLYKFLGDLLDEGNNVVLGIDTNDDVIDGEVTKALMEIAMYEAVVSNHDGESVPVIYATNKQRKPIDSIQTFPGLTVLRCGVLPFHDVYGFQSDHQLFWADMCNEDLLGHRPQHSYRAPTSKDRSNDLDIRKKYIQRCLEKYGCDDVINDFETFASFCQKTRKGYDMRDEIIHLHAPLAIKIEKIQIEVDKSLDQFFTRLIPWLPTLQVHCDRTD